MVILRNLKPLPTSTDRQENHKGVVKNKNRSLGVPITVPNKTSILLKQSLILRDCWDLEKRVLLVLSTRFSQKVRFPIIRDPGTFFSKISRNFREKKLLLRQYLPIC